MAAPRDTSPFACAALVAAALATTGCVALPWSANAPRSAASEPRGESPSSATSTSLATASPRPTCDSPESDAAPDSADDGFEAPGSTAARPAGGALPFAELSDAEIASKLKEDIGALGSISIGPAHEGVLIAGVQLPEGANWERVSPALAWGTRETIEGITHAIDAVAARFPNTPKALIGNISTKQGGRFFPHLSHQSGRDVDLSYYLTEGHRWYAGAHAANLDRARTWHLVRTLIADSDVDLVFVDIAIQRVLKAYALEIGEDPEWLDQVFQAGGKSRRPIVFHANGHATHLHVRFFSPAARELGRRAYPLLVARHLVAPPATSFVVQTAKHGETLTTFARRLKVSPESLKKANGLTSEALRAGKAYRVPQSGGIAIPAPLALPSRRTPPSPSTVARGKRAWDGEQCKRVSMLDQGP